jgi:hypothetical protein
MSLTGWPNISATNLFFGCQMIWLMASNLRSDMNSDPENQPPPAGMRRSEPPARP